MVECCYVHEIIHYNKDMVCGWSYREIKYRIDYKNKNRKTKFITYKGYCQYEHESFYDDIGDNFEEIMNIYSEEHSFPKKRGKEYNKIVRKGYFDWISGKHIYHEDKEK